VKKCPRCKRSDVEFSEEFKPLCDDCYVDLEYGFSIEEQVKRSLKECILKCIEEQADSSKKEGGNHE
jgi:transposase-like protein